MAIDMSAGFSAQKKGFSALASSAHDDYFAFRRRSLNLTEIADLPGTVLFLLFIITLVVSPEALTFSGKVIDDKNNNTPIPNVLVSFEHTIYRTHTDSMGRFSLDIPESGIKRDRPNTAASFFKITFECRKGLLLLPGSGTVSRIAMYRIDGKQIFSKPVSDDALQISLPKLSSGLVFLSLTFKNGLTSTSRLINLSRNDRFAVPFKIREENLRPHASSAALYRFIFRHDRFFPVDRDFAATSDTLRVGMELDPRSLFFDENTVHTMSFTLTHEDSLTMEREAILEQYIPAELVFNGSPLGKVGFRYKGSVYSLYRCFDDNGNRSEYDDCRNVSLKVKFNKINETLRFYHMKQLNLHAMSYDGSKMREMFSYGLFRDMGIYTCRTVFVKVYVNNVFRGIFTAVEEVDGRFTKARWPLYGDGNLYKEAWPSDPFMSYYNEKLKTNNDPGDIKQPIRMVKMAQAIKKASPADFADKIAPFMDLNYFINYIVVDRAIHNADGIMAWYTGDNWLVNHNFYFYEEENEGGRAWIIPWDLNATLTPTDPIIDDHDIPDWNVEPETCDPLPAWGGDLVTPPNCDKLIKLTAATSWEKFREAGRYFLAKIMTTDRMQARLDRLAALIAPVMENEPTISKEKWNGDIEWLRNTFPVLVKGFNDHLDGTTQQIDSSGFFTQCPVDTPFSVQRRNNFEFATPPGELSWTDLFISENSDIGLLFDTAAPLWGKGGLRADFTFNPAGNTGNYAEWSFVGLRFGETTDFSSIDSVKICLQADLPRNCRISLESEEYDSNEVKEKYGWQINANTKRLQFSFAIKDMTYPEWGNSSNPDIREAVKKSVNGIGIIIFPRWGSDGRLLTVPDSGFLKIDNIEFIAGK